MLLAQRVEPFLAQRPYCVLVRAAVERMLDPARLNQVFRENAARQYEREPLFSSLVAVMARVVTRIEPPVLASYRSLQGELGVSDEAVYQKLRQVETGVSEALARDSFAVARAVPQELNVGDDSWVRGLRVKLLDGDYLQKTHRRIAELRTMWDAPLPGRAPVVWDQPTRLLERVFLTGHGLASERSLRGRVLESVKADDLWIADRNFCTLGFLFGLADRKARFVIRRHGQLQGTPRGPGRRAGQTEKGGPLWEQEGQIASAGRTRTVRRITVELGKPTRDGDRELHVFGDPTREQASAAKIAAPYGRRWTIGVVFLELQTALSCEVETLGYPKAALFAFCVALLLQNTFSLLAGSLRSAHGTAKIDQEVSGVRLAQGLRKAYDGMMVQIPPVHWEGLSQMSVQQFARRLKAWAARLNLTRYRKTPRGRKRPPPKRKPRSRGGRISTARILSLRQPQQ